MFNVDGHKIVVRDSQGVEINTGYTVEHHEQKLKEEKEQLRADLERAHFAERENLQLRYDNVSLKLDNLQQSYEDAVRLLDEARQELQRYSNQFPHDDITNAMKGIEEDDLKAAGDLIALAQGNITQRRQLNEAEREEIDKDDARLELLQAKIAENDIRWHDAYAHAKRAYDLGQEVEVLDLYARMAGRLGRNEEGVGLQKLRMRRAADDHGEESVQYASALNNLAGLYKAQGRYEAAEPLHKQAMEIRRVALGEEHPDFATSLNNLAALYYTLGRYEDALPLIDQDVAIFEAALPTGQPDIDIARNVQAGIRAALGDA